MTKAEAMRAYLDELSERVKLTDKLRKLKAEKRAMWRALSKRCEFLCHTGNCDRDGIGKCTQRNCPLMKGKVKK
jgi:hypothetical protein